NAFFLPSFPPSPLPSFLLPPPSPTGHHNSANPGPLHSHTLQDRPSHPSSHPTSPLAFFPPLPPSPQVIIILLIQALRIATHYKTAPLASLSLEYLQAFLTLGQFFFTLSLLSFNYLSLSLFSQILFGFSAAFILIPATTLLVYDAINNHLELANARMLQRVWRAERKRQKARFDKMDPYDLVPAQEICSWFRPHIIFATLLSKRTEERTLLLRVRDRFETCRLVGLAPMDWLNHLKKPQLYAVLAQALLGASTGHVTVARVPKDGWFCREHGVWHAAGEDCEGSEGFGGVSGGGGGGSGSGEGLGGVEREGGEGSVGRGGLGPRAREGMGNGGGGVESGGEDRRNGQLSGSSGQQREDSSGESQVNGQVDTQQPLLQQTGRNTWHELDEADVWPPQLESHVSWASASVAAANVDTLGVSAGRGGRGRGLGTGWDGMGGAGGGVGGRAGGGGVWGVRGAGWEGMVDADTASVGSDSSSETGSTHGRGGGVNLRSMGGGGGAMGGVGSADTFAAAASRAGLGLRVGLVAAAGAGPVMRRTPSIRVQNLVSWEETPHEGLPEHGAGGAAGMGDGAAAAGGAGEEAVEGAGAAAAVGGGAGAEAGAGGGGENGGGGGGGGGGVNPEAAGRRQRMGGWWGRGARVSERGGGTGAGAGAGEAGTGMGEAGQQQQPPQQQQYQQQPEQRERAGGGGEECVEARMNMGALSLAFQKHLALLVRAERTRSSEALRLLVCSEAVPSILSWLTSAERCVKPY
ncbi:unnamed protein product, partial [Closterium sp. NIES-53]